MEINQLPVFAAWILFSPDHKGKDLEAVTEIADEKSRMAVVANLFTPILDCVDISIGKTGRHIADCGGAIEVGIDHFQLVVIMFVRMLVGAWITCVIHAGPKIGIIKVFILMIETKSMTDFLAHDQIAPSRSVVGGCVKVCIIQFDRCLGDVIAIRPNGCNPKPAIVAILCIADFNPSTRGRTPS